MITPVIRRRQEKKDKNKARVVSFLMFLILLIVFGLPFISGTLETQQDYERVITIQFDEEFFPSAAAEKSSSSAAAAGEAEDEEAPAPEEPVEEVVEEVVEEQPEERVIEPIPNLEPVTQNKPLITSVDSDVAVNVSTLMKEISEKALVKEVAEEVTEVTEEVSSDFMDEIAAYFGESSGSGASGSASSGASGNRSTKGTGSSGSSDSGNSNSDGKANSGTAGMDFDGDGLLTRKVIYRADVNSLIEQSGRIVINLCVNRDGRVIYSKIDKKKTTVFDPAILRKAELTAAKYRYEKDYTVAERQCGKLSFIVDIQD